MESSTIVAYFCLIIVAGICLYQALFIRDLRKRRADDNAPVEYWGQLRPGSLQLKVWIDARFLGLWKYITSSIKDLTKARRRMAKALAESISDVRHTIDTHVKFSDSGYRYIRTELKLAKAKIADLEKSATDAYGPALATLNKTVHRLHDENLASKRNVANQAGMIEELITRCTGLEAANIAAGTAIGTETAQRRGEVDIIAATFGPSCETKIAKARE